MLTYFARVGLPGWKALSKVQRRFVWRQCVHPFLFRGHLMVAKTFLIALAVFFASRSGAFTTMPSTFIAAFVVVFLVTDLFELCVIARHRRQVSSFIESHGAEIQHAA